MRGSNGRRTTVVQVHTVCGATVTMASVYVGDSEKIFKVPWCPACKRAYPEETEERVEASWR